MIKNIKAILWDLDGTLIDSEELHAQSSAYASGLLAKENGLRLMPISTNVTGLENQAVFEMLFQVKISGENYTLFERWERLAVDYVIERISSDQQIKQSIHLVNHFGELGIPQLVVSNSTKRLVLHSLTLMGIIDKCEYVLCRDMVGNGKPHPELYLTALDKIKIAAERCLAFEDSYSGITAARRAGLNVVGIGESSSKHSPDLVMDLTQDKWLQKLDNYYNFG